MWPRGYDDALTREAEAAVAGLSWLDGVRYERALAQLFLDPTPSHPLVTDLRDQPSAPSDFVLTFHNVAVYFDQVNALVVSIVAVRAGA